MYDWFCKNCVLFLALVFVSSGAWAQSWTNGQTEEATCKACHVAGGLANPLTGRNPSLTRTQLRNGINSSPLMTGFQSWTDAQLDDLAFFLANPNGLPVLAPVATLSANNLSFGNQTINTTSGAQTLTLGNTGNAMLNVSTVAVSGDFAKSGGTCANNGTVAAGSSCTIMVTFTPTATGARAGQVTITDNATGSPRAVALQGSGIAVAAPVATLSASNLSFGNQTINTTSAVQTLTLGNTGNATLNVSTVAVSGDFAKSGGTCVNNGTVSAGSSCTITITFTPTAAGARTGLVTITDNATGSPRTATLQGMGVALAGPTATLLPAKLTFAAQALGTPSTVQSLTLTNTSKTAVLNITGMAIGGGNVTDFSSTTTCGATLATGANCTISVTFKPTVSGLRTATLNVVSNATGPLSAALEGTGNAPTTGPAVTLDVKSLVFADQSLNTPSAPKTVTLSNTGGGTLNIASMKTSGDFAQTSTCGAQLIAGAKCVISSVTFTPTAAGARTGALTLMTDAPGSPHTVTLSGNGSTGVLPSLSYSPNEMEFHDHLPVGTTSKPQIVTVRNAGPGTLQISGISILGNAKSDFAQTSDCTSVAPKGSCTINVTFTPTAGGGRQANLSIASNAPGRAAIVKLAGEGIGKGGDGGGDDLTPSTPTLQFDMVKSGQVSGALEVLVMNHAAAPMTVADISVSSSNFAKQVDSCSGATLASGQTCSVKVSFQPQSSGTYEADLTIANQTSGSQTKVALAGTALPADATIAPETTASPSTGGGCALNTKVYFFSIQWSWPSSPGPCSGWRC